MYRSPFQLWVTAVSVPVGVLAVILGSQVSTAMSRVLGAQFDVVRLWGALLIVGGSAATYGLYSRRAGVERAGLRMLAGAFTLYAISVLLGLGLGGLVTGPMFLGLAGACFTRVRLSVRAEAVAGHADELLKTSTPDAPPDDG